MKKDYLKPDSWIFDFTAECMGPMDATPSSGDGGLVKPARRAGSPDGPAGL